MAVSTSASTLPGSYSIEVQRLASVQSNATGVYASADALVGEGTLHIELGTWGAGQTSFTPKAGATAVDIAVGPPAESLAQLRDKINASNSGVVASVLTDASGARLVLRSAATGEANGFRVGVTDTDGNNLDGIGLSALAFDPSAGILTMAQALAAANASASLNGLPIASASNTLSNVLDGITLTLGKVTTAPVLVEAKPDKDADPQGAGQLRHRLQRPEQAGRRADQVRRRQQDRRRAAGRQRGGVDPRADAQPAGQQQRRLGHVHAAGRHRLRRAERRLDQARRDQARQWRWPTWAR